MNTHVWDNEMGEGGSIKLLYGCKQFLFIIYLLMYHPWDACFDLFHFLFLSKINKCVCVCVCVCVGGWGGGGLQWECLMCIFCSGSIVFYILKAQGSEAYHSTPFIIQVLVMRWSSNLYKRNVLSTDFDGWCPYVSSHITDAWITDQNHFSRCLYY